MTCWPSSKAQVLSVCLFVLEETHLYCNRHIALSFCTIFKLLLFIYFNHLIHNQPFQYHRKGENLYQYVGLPVPNHSVYNHSFALCHQLICLNLGRFIMVGIAKLFWLGKKSIVKETKIKKLSWKLFLSSRLLAYKNINNICLG